MVSIFGDESADQHVERVFAIAGLIGTEDQWNELVGEWLFWTEGKEFHAAEWETEFAYDPDPRKHKKNLATYGELAKLIARSGIHGWAVGLDLAGYRTFFPHITQDLAYHKCFIEVADRLVKEAKLLGYDELGFVFDQRQGQSNTGVLYDYMSSQPEWKETGIFFEKKISFSSRKNPRIQIVDLVAREAMKFLDNELSPKKRPIRKSMIALASANQRLQFDFLMKEYFEGLKKELPHYEEMTGMKLEIYRRWLIENKIADNLGSRYRFMIWHSAKELTEPQDGCAEA